MLWPTVLQEQETCPLSKHQQHEVCKTPPFINTRAMPFMPRVRFPEELAVVSQRQGY
jgi:hypothetical protein